ncbi:MAG: DASS family sodium-coupled anion symporter [Chitinophagaceae bacterium]|nr:DASS family sodium-coupled anion symporter [Chitinophagaceae bacterium]
MQNWVGELWHYIDPRKRNTGKKSLLFVAVVGITYLITTWIATDDYSFNEFYTLWLCLMAMGLWLTEAVPAFAVGLFIIGFQVLTLANKAANPDPIDALLFTNTIANPIIWLMLGGFFLAGGLRKTGLDQQLLLITLKYFGPSANKLLFGVMLTTMAMSMLMSNTAATAMMLAMVMPFLKSLGNDSTFRKSFVLGVPAAATLGGMGTIIGSPPNAIAGGVLEKAGMPIDFTEWMYMGVLPAVLLTIGLWYFFIKMFPSEIGTVYSGSMETSNTAKNVKPGMVWIVRITLVVTILGWLTASIHKIPTHIIAILPVVIFPLTGIIASEDFNALSWDTLILVAGGLSLGTSMIDSGLADRLLGYLTLNDVPLLILALVFGYVAMLFSNIMSNTATAAILIPLAVQLMPQHMELLATSIALCSSCALLLPVSTPPNALAFSTGFLNQKDFRKSGLLIGLGGPLIINLWLVLLFG